MSLSRTLVSFGMLVIFIIAILGFAMNFSEDNNSATDINDDTDIQSLYDNATQKNSTYLSSANNTYASIVNSTIDPVGQTIVSGGIFTFGVGDYFSVFKNIVAITYKKIFGGSDEFGVFFSILLGLIIVLISYYIISAWLGRNPN